jgi:opacity protein-like surface antigen
MKRIPVVAVLTLLILALRPSPASADITAFFGVSPTPATRTTEGVAIGISLIVVGFEFEYGKTKQDDPTASPALTTGMGNLMVMTPTNKVQLYATTGGGIFHETYRTIGTTNFATNLGGGVKMALAGPIRLRLDYRVFKLNGTSTIYKTVQRMYGGLSLSF